MITVEIVGLRDLQGRFSSMRDGELVAYQAGRAVELADGVRAVYEHTAPRSKTPREKDTRRTIFAESFDAHSQATGKGFDLEVTTDQGDLRKWLRDGTPPHEIRPKNAQALHFFGAHGETFARLVHHPGTRSSAWEREALAEVEPLAEHFGNRIGAWTASRLSGI